MHKHQRSPSSNQWACSVQEDFKVLLASDNLILNAMNLSPMKSTLGRDLLSLHSFSFSDSASQLTRSPSVVLLNNKAFASALPAQIFAGEELMERIWSTTEACNTLICNIMQVSDTKGRDSEMVEMELMGRDLCKGSQSVFL